MEIFLKYSLEGLPKKVLITDGHPAYPAIIERICIKHQLCIFHIIKNHNDKSYKKINRIQWRIQTLETKIEENKDKITELKKLSKGLKGPVSKKDTTRKKKNKKAKKIRTRKQKIQKRIKTKKKRIKRTRTNQRKNIKHLWHKNTKGSNKKIQNNISPTRSIRRQHTKIPKKYKQKIR